MESARLARARHRRSDDPGATHCIARYAGSQSLAALEALAVRLAAELDSRRRTLMRIYGRFVRLITLLAATTLLAASIAPAVGAHDHLDDGPEPIDPSDPLELHDASA